MANISIPPGKFRKMIDACEEMHSRIPAQGMPELDEEFEWMIGEMEKAYAEALGPPQPEEKE
jgi:hypothetical protein